jgi:hypothetical protein
VPKTSYELQQDLALRRKYPANCSKISPTAESILQTAARFRQPPKVSCKLQEGFGARLNGLYKTEVKSFKLKVKMPVPHNGIDLQLT